MQYVIIVLWMALIATSVMIAWYVLNWQGAVVALACSSIGMMYPTTPRLYE